MIHGTIYAVAVFWLGLFAAGACLKWLRGAARWLYAFVVFAAGIVGSAYFAFVWRGW